MPYKNVIEKRASNNNQLLELAHNKPRANNGNQQIVNNKVLGQR